MSVTLMTSAEMLSVLESWLGEHRKVFEAYPKWKVLLPDLEESQQELRTLAPAGAGTTDALSVDALTKEIEPWEARHDAKYRGAMRFIEGAIEDAESADDLALLREGLRVLFPGGTSGTNASFQGEAGNAARAQAQLALPENKALRERLKAMHTGRGKRTVLDVIEDYIEAGAKVGALDAKRTALIAGHKAEAAESGGSKGLGVRGRWLAVTKDVVRMARRAPADKQAGLRAALAVFDKAVERAGHRVGSAPEAPPVEVAPPAGTEKTPAKG